MRTSMACVYCSSLSSIVEMGRAGWDFFMLLLEERRRVMAQAPSLSFYAHPELLPELSRAPRSPLQ